MQDAASIPETGEEFESGAGQNGPAGQTGLVAERPLQLGPKYGRWAGRWGFAYEMFDAIVKLYGTPGDLAKQSLMPRYDWAGACVWLSALECMVRRLLLILSAYVKLPALAPRAERKTREKKANAKHSGRAGWANDEPVKWPVSFSYASSSFGPAEDAQNGIKLSAGARRLLGKLSTPERLLKIADRLKRLRDGTLPPRRSKRRGDAFISTLPVAARLEALRRVLDNPELYAARLARLLQERSDAVLKSTVEPEHLSHFITRAMAPPGTAIYDFRWALDDLHDPALQAGLRFIPTG